MCIAMMDGEFKCIRHELGEEGIQVNISGREDHVGEVERYIRTVKERMRCVFNSLLYALSRKLTVELANYVVFWLNAFPAEGGVSITMTGGTSDGRFIATLCREVVEFGPVNATIHKLNERVALADVARLSRIYERALSGLLAGPAA